VGPLQLYFAPLAQASSDGTVHQLKHLLTFWLTFAFVKQGFLVCMNISISVVSFACMETLTPQFENLILVTC